MRIFLDTSVLVAAVIQKHESHTRSFAILERVQNEKDRGFLAAHSLAEIYCVLTKSPPPFRHSPEQALLSIEENVAKYFETSFLTGPEYGVLIRDAALRGVQGGTIYDALLVKCAQKAQVEKVYTLNVKHFEALDPKDNGLKIVSP